MRNRSKRYNELPAICTPFLDGEISPSAFSIHTCNFAGLFSTSNAERHASKKVRSSVVVFVEADLIVLNVLTSISTPPLFFISAELLGGGITIVDHPLLCFLPLHYNIAVLVAAMLLLFFIVFALFFNFFRNFYSRLGCCNHAHSCILLTPLLLPACHNVNRFVASSLFLCRVIFSYSYRILLLC